MCVYVCFEVMYCSYQDREELEDDLYQEGDGDSDESEANSELEFHLYSQLHYSSNAGDTGEQVDREEDAACRENQQPEVPVKSADVDRERKHNGESTPSSLEISKLLQNLKKEERRETEERRGKKRKSTPKDQRSSSSFFEEVIVIDSSPNVISISDDTADDDEEGVCALKGQSSQRVQTSTPAREVMNKESHVECDFLCTRKCIACYTPISVVTLQRFPFMRSTNGGIFIVGYF